MSPLIINLAPTGARPTQARNCAVPLTRDEIVTDGCAAVQTGASMIHLHVRDAESSGRAAATDADERASLGLAASP